MLPAGCAKLGSGLIKTPQKKVGRFNESRPHFFAPLFGGPARCGGWGRLGGEEEGFQGTLAAFMPDTLVHSAAVGFGSIALLVAANAYFVATEFSLVAARRTRLEEHVSA